MSGIAALAAAAAATQKINTTAGVTTTPVSGIKVVTPTVVSPSGVKVTPVSGRTSELVVSSMLVCFHHPCNNETIYVNHMHYSPVW